jgi:RND family efflux transporter MFP subunit
MGGLPRRANMARRAVVVGLTLACAALVFAPAWFLHGDRPLRVDDDPQEIAQTAPHAAGPAANGHERFLGVLLARQTLDVAAHLDGRINRVLVALGDHVPQGGLIATIDVRAIERELAIAEAMLRAAVAEHERVMLELADVRERLQRSRHLGDLVSRETVTAAEYQEQIVAARGKSAGALVAERQARVEQLRGQLLEAVVRAPFEGVVSARHVNPGAVVNRGTPVVTLISSERPWVRFAVPEERLALIRTGQRVRVTLDAMPIELHGTVQHIAPEVDAAARMVFVEAALDVPGPDVSMPSGAVARVAVVSDW